MPDGRDAPSAPRRVLPARRGRCWSTPDDGLATLVYDPDAARTIRSTPPKGLRYLLRFLAAGITVCVEHDDTETPEFGRMIENRVSWGLDNPDMPLLLHTGAG